GFCDRRTEAVPVKDKAVRSAAAEGMSDLRRSFLRALFGLAEHDSHTEDREENNSAVKEYHGTDTESVDQDAGEGGAHSIPQIAGDAVAGLSLDFIFLRNILVNVVNRRRQRQGIADHLKGLETGQQPGVGDKA